jgi:hypothetical protein
MRKLSEHITYFSPNMKQGRSIKRPEDASITQYFIIDIFLLSFIINDEQRDILFNKDTKGHLEFNGNTVWYVDGEGTRWESITTPNIIEVGLKRNAIEKIW